MLARSAACVLFSAILWGVMEGATYPSQGPPRIPLLLYWPLLGMGLLATSLGVHALLEEALPPGTPQSRPGLVAPLLPFAFVVQDAASLAVQGSAPWEATWYAAVFGPGLHTGHDPFLGLPVGYYVLSALSLALLVMRVRGASRPTRAPG